MRLSEIKPQKPKTPNQQKIANLQITAKRAQQTVKAEKAKQKMQQAQQFLAMVRQPTNW